MTVSKELVEPEVQVVYVDDAIAAGPAVPIAPAGENTNLVATPGAVQEGSEVDCNLCGDTRIRGRRVFTKRNVFVSLCGNTVVDFRDSNLPEGSSLSLIIVMLCGDVKLYVQRGTQVKVCRVMLCGDKESDEEGRFESSIKISVYILGLCGSVIVSNSPEDAK